MNQYECSMATPRSNSACTLGSQEVGKLTLPSFWSSWVAAPPASAAVIRPAANNVRPHCMFIVCLLWFACDDSVSLLPYFELAPICSSTISKARQFLRPLQPKAYPPFQRLREPHVRRGGLRRAEFTLL